MRAAALALSAAVGLLLAVPAEGRSFTDRLEPLVDSVSGRKLEFTGVLTKEEARRRKALERALAAMARPGTSVGRDLSVAAAVAALLEREFPGDGEFGAVLDAALDGFRAAHVALGDRLAEFVAGIPSGERRRDRALGAMAEAEGLVDASDAAGLLSDRARLLGRAVKRLDAAWKAALALKGTDAKRTIPASAGSLSASVDGAGHVADGVVARYNPGLAFFQVASLEILDPATGGFLVLQVDVSTFHGPGTYPLTMIDLGPRGPGVLPMGLVAESPAGVGGTLFGTRLESPWTGTLVVTTFDEERRLVAGTFSFLALEKDPGTATRSVTGGTFRAAYRVFR